MNIDGYGDLSLVGAGGNAHVYRASQFATGDVVAIKVLRGGGDPGVARRFARERDAMDALVALDNVAPILESGTTDAGDPYLVMPLFEGGSLQQRIVGGPVPWREALGLVHKVSSAVAQAHERRILHLDVKPANVLLDGSGEPFLADFGIAESMGTTASMSAQMLTPAYTPPERLNGSKPSEQTDIYGLGGLLFALLAGEAPFVLEAGMTPAAMFVAVLNHDVSTVKIDGVAPAVVVELVASTLSKSIDERPQTALELCERIEEILDDDSLRAFDPVIGFRLAAEDETASHPGEAAGQSEVSVDEIIGEAAIPLDADRELISFATPLERSDDEDDDDRLFAIWVAAALIFICVGIAGAITATAWNDRDTRTGGGGGAESLVLDALIDNDVATAGSTTELTSSPATQQPQVGGLAQSADDRRRGDETDGSSPADREPSVGEVLDSDGFEGDIRSDVDGDVLDGDRISVIVAGVAEDAAGPAGVVPPIVDAIPINSTPVTVPDADEQRGEQGRERVAEGTPAPTTAPTTTVARPVTTRAPRTTTAAPQTTIAAPQTTTTTTTTTAAPKVTTTQVLATTEPLEFEERIDIGSLSDTQVRFRFTTSSNTGYTATIRSGGSTVTTRTGTAAAGQIESVTVNGLTPGTDYTVQVTLNGESSVTSTPVAFRTSGGNATTAAEQVAVENLRLASTESTRFQVNYESNVCANGSFVIREAGGAVVGSNAGQASGCTTRHLGVPGFWTPALRPNTTYVITVTVEANGQGQGNGNTASQSLTVTTAG